MKSCESTAIALNDIVSRWFGCVSCGLAKGRTMQVWGRPIGSLAPSQLVIVGEAPGREEDLSGEAFVGRSGKLLDQWLESARIESAFITNTVVCRPPDNRDPTRSELKSCWGRLFSMLRILQPIATVAVGRISGQWLLNMDKSVGHMAVRIYRLKVGNFQTVVIPIHHPAYFLRNRDPKIEAATIERLKIAKYLIEKGSK